MHVETRKSTHKDKSYTYYYLRQSYREDGNGRQHEVAERWRDLDVTVQEGIDMLSTLCATQVIVKGKPGCNRIPKPARPLQRLLDAARVTLPEALPNNGE